MDFKGPRRPGEQKNQLGMKLLPLRSHQLQRLALFLSHTPPPSSTYSLPYQGFEPNSRAPSRLCVALLRSQECSDEPIHSEVQLPGKRDPSQIPQLWHYRGRCLTDAQNCLFQHHWTGQIIQICQFCSSAHLPDTQNLFSVPVFSGMLLSNLATCICSSHTSSPHRRQLEGRVCSLFRGSQEITIFKLGLFLFYLVSFCNFLSSCLQSGK